MNLKDATSPKKLAKFIAEKSKGIVPLLLPLSACALPDIHIRNQMGDRVADIYGINAKDKAAFIVRAVNSHEALVKALEDYHFAVTEVIVANNAGDIIAIGQAVDSLHEVATRAQAIYELAKSTP